MTQQPNNHSDSPRRTQKKKPAQGSRKKREKIIMVVAIILAVVMVLAATLVVLYQRWGQKPTLPAGNTPSSSVPVSLAPGESDALPDIDAVAPLSSGERKSADYFTILVFGADETSGLTDTIMVVSYDVTNQKATVMSIPRDTTVNVRSSYKSINGVYNNNGRGEDGIQALKTQVSKLVGFVPDYYVMIDWELVGQMVDAIGGVYFDVPYHMGYDDPYQDLHIHFEPGYQYLNGEDAMNLVRWRKNNDGTATPGGGGDTSRLDVQHQFLKAVLSQTLQLKNVTRIGQLAELFGENVVSDLTIENLFWFGSQAIMGGLNVDDVNFVTMPYSGGYGAYEMKVCPNWNQLLELINESLNPYVEDVTMKQLDLIRINKDGSLTSSRGKLADSSASRPTVVQEPSPSPSTEPSASPAPSVSPSPGISPDPSASGDPAVSPTPVVPDDPGVSGSPTPSGEPVPSQPPSESTAPAVDPNPSESPAAVNSVSPTIPDWLLPAETQAP